MSTFKTGSRLSPRTRRIRLTGGGDLSYDYWSMNVGTPKMIHTGLDRKGLRQHFRWVGSADSVKLYKPSPTVYQLALDRNEASEARGSVCLVELVRCPRRQKLWFKVCWIGRIGSLLDTLGLAPDLEVTDFDELIDVL